MNDNHNDERSLDQRARNAAAAAKSFAAELRIGSPEGAVVKGRRNNRWFAIGIAAALGVAAVASIGFVASKKDAKRVDVIVDPGTSTTTSTNRQSPKRVLLENREVLGDRPANVPIPSIIATRLQPGSPPGKTSATQIDYSGMTCVDLMRIDPATWHTDTKKSTCYALGPSLLGGDAIEHASASINQDQWGVDVEYERGAFAVIATEYVNKRVAIVVDGIVISAPVINQGITGDSVRISGAFSEAEAKGLAAALLNSRIGN